MFLKTILKNVFSEKKIQQKQKFIVVITVINIFVPWPPRAKLEFVGIFLFSVLVNNCSKNEISMHVL